MSKLNHYLGGQRPPMIIDCAVGIHSQNLDEEYKSAFKYFFRVINIYVETRLEEKKCFKDSNCVLVMIR